YPGRRLRTHRTHAPGRQPGAVRRRRGPGGAVGARPGPGPLFHGRRARLQPTGFLTMTGTLILVRHGQSEWNLKNLFTGWRDPPLTEQGIEEAKHCGRELNKYGFIPDYCFTSSLQRAQHTLDLILDEGKIFDITITRNRALNERDYGDLSGLNKDDARAKWGEEQVLIW